MNQEYIPQTFYMIITITDGRNCYYSRGIYISHIPFASADQIELQKITFVGKKKFRHDLLPAFRRFQCAWRRRSKWIKRCIKNISKREVTGQQFDIPSFLG